MKSGVWPRKGSPLFTTAPRSINAATVSLRPYCHNFSHCDPIATRPIQSQHETGQRIIKKYTSFKIYTPEQQQKVVFFLSIRFVNISAAINQQSGHIFVTTLSLVILSKKSYQQSRLHTVHNAFTFSEQTTKQRNRKYIFLGINSPLLRQKAPFLQNY